ncbi:MAG: cupredoxin domain-containing protein [Coriobacteriia bacterium]|nr:cupredoxin domain-containing protein [Coriobacteriia bacterium]
MNARIRIPAAICTLLLVASLSACGQPAPTQSAPGGAQPPAAVFDGAPTGAATVEGGVQRISVDVSQGFYDPTILTVKSGVPVEIVFGQGQGCLASVLFPDFGVDQDLTNGGATVKLPAMKPGEYVFSCGMRMVFGKVVAR